MIIITVYLSVIFRTENNVVLKSKLNHHDQIMIDIIIDFIKNKFDTAKRNVRSLTIKWHNTLSLEEGLNAFILCTK